MKFEGHFHGYHDYLGYSAWPPAEQAGPAERRNRRRERWHPERTAGVRHRAAVQRPETLERTLRAPGHEIAAVILEPINFNSGGILPQPGYLRRCAR